MDGGRNTSTYLQQNGSSAQRVACVIHFGGDLGRISRERPGCACGLGPLRGRSWAPCRPGRFWGPGHGARRPGRVPPPVRSAGLLRYARPWPPLGSVGPLRALPGGPACASGSAPGLGPWPLAGPLALARAPPLPWGRSGVAPAYRRAACARRRGRGAPPGGPAAAWPVPAPGGLGSPGARPPPRGVWAGGLLSLAAPWRGRCAPAASRPAPPPSSPRVPLPPALSGGPANALGRPASSLRGRLGGGCAAPLSRRRPLRGGVGCRLVRCELPPAPGSGQGSSRAALPPLTRARPGGLWKVSGPARPGPVGPTILPNPVIFR